MMSDLQTALKTSGLKVPTTARRIYNWLLEHKDQTSRQISKGLNLDHTKCCGILLNLHQARRVTRVKTLDKWSKMSLYVYNVAGVDYEHPLKLVNVPKPVSTVVVTQAVPLPRKQTFDIEACTIQELRDLRDRLNRLFEVLK